MFNIIMYIIDQGVPQKTVIMVLMLPVIATFITFFRQIIGLSGFGIYTPLITTFAFLATGLKYGLVIFALVLLISILVRIVLKFLRLLYLPRMAIVLSMIALGILGLFLFAAEIGNSNFLFVSIFPILILIALGENFVSAQAGKGTRAAIILSIETMILAVVGFYLASWSWLQVVLLKHPAWILLTFVINIILGRWTGLRLLEYIRFRDVIKREILKSTAMGKRQ